MNTSSVPPTEGDGKRGGLPLRPWLLGLVLGAGRHC
jgi:hypothetical protein